MNRTITARRGGFDSTTKEKAQKIFFRAFQHSLLG